MAARKTPGSPPKAHRFKKGQSGNPLGGKLHDPAVKAFKNLTKAEMVIVGNMIIKGDIEGIKELAKDPKANVLQAMIASVAARVISKGDMQALDVLLNRLIGKVKDEVLHSGDVLNAPQIVVTMPSNGRRAEENEK